MIGICTDSNAQFPPSLAARFGVEVVPVTVRIGDEEYLEGVDLDADTFYARFDPAREMATCQPSPGQFALAYERLAERGATEILSIHVGSAVSGSLSSARLAARHSPVPVRLVDTGAASFGVAGCTWAAAEAVAAGATLDQAASTAEALGPHVGNVFVLQVAAVLKMRCRPADQPTAAPVPILSFADGRVGVVDQVTSFEDTVAHMAAYVQRWRPTEGCRLNVGIAVADVSGESLADALANALRSGREIHDLVHYRIGPSVGTQTGPAAVGAFFYRV